MLVVCSRSKCKRLADPAAMPINKNSRSGERKRPMCVNCLAARARELEKCRTMPTAAYIAKVARSNSSQQGSETAVAKSWRHARRRTGGDASMTAHALVHDSLRRTLKKGCDSVRILQITGLPNGAALCAHFHAKALASGFQNGLNDYGHRDNQWSISHIIPQYAYDGSIDSELRKCWDLRNLTCQSKRTNCSNGRNFDETQVPVTLYPVDWNGQPCTLARRRQITGKVTAHVGAVQP